MIRICNVVLSLIVMLSLSACATVASGPSYAEIETVQAKEGYAILYVFREYAEPTAWGSKILVDSEPVATLNQKGFTQTYIKPGTREIWAKWGSTTGQQDSKISLKAETGKIYYIELTGISQLANTRAVGLDIVWDVITGSGLGLVNPTDAEKRLQACCCLLYTSPSPRDQRGSRMPSSA